MGIKEEKVEKESLKSEDKDTKEQEKEEIKQEDKNSSNEKDEKVDISDKDQSTKPLKAEESDREKDSKVSEPEANSDNTAPDSFINDIYTTEGRQTSPEKELEEPSSHKTGDDLVADIKSNDLDDNKHNASAKPQPEIKQEDKNSSDEKDEKEENIKKEQTAKPIESEKIDEQDSDDKADSVTKSILETKVESEKTKEDKKSSITVEKTSSIVVEKTIQIEKNSSESQFESLSLEKIDASVKSMQEGEDPATSKPDEKSPVEKIIQDDKKNDKSKERSESNLSQESKDGPKVSSESLVEKVDLLTKKTMDEANDVPLDDDNKDQISSPDEKDSKTKIDGNSLNHENKQEGSNADMQMSAGEKNDNVSTLEVLKDEKIEVNIQKNDDIQSAQKEDSKFIPGVLEITVKKASELVNNDRIGKSDPYVKIRYSDVEFRSKTIQNTLEPEWNFSCKFDILNLEERYIHINVYDDDFGKDNIEGCYSLSLKEAMSDSAEEGCWYNLVGCKTGKVFICTSFTPIKMEDSSTGKPVQEAKTTDISKDKEVPVLETSENKSESKDIAPDSFINDIYTSVGKQAVPEKEKDPSVSKPDDKDTEESVLPSSIKIESTNKINVSQQEEHSSKLEVKEENSTESIPTEKSKEPESDSLPSEDNNTINEISVEKRSW